MSFGEDVVALVQSSSDPVLQKAPHWERVSLGEVARIMNGYPWDSKFFGSEGVPLLRIRDVTAGETNTRYSGPVVDGYDIVKGDLLIGMDGDFNLRRWASETAILNQRVCKIDADTNMYDTIFLEYLLPRYLKLINEHTSSVTVKHLSSKTVANIPLPLPPLAEQRRIAAKLEILNASLTRAGGETSRALALANRLRDQVLEKVFGRATSSGWPLSKMGNLLSESQIGLVRSKSEQGNSGTPYIRMNHFDANGTWNCDKLTNVTCTSMEMRRYELASGDLLFNTRNSIDLVGKVALWPEGRRGHVYNNNLLRMRFTNKLIPHFVFLLMLSPTFKNELEKLKSGTTSVAAIYQRDLFELSLPVPTLETQRAIITYVERAFTRANCLEAEATRATKLLKHLEMSFLAKAFRGELVPQDPADEPAAALLDRIRAERAATLKSKRGGRVASTAGG